MSDGPKTSKGKKRKNATGDGRKLAPDEEVNKAYKKMNKAYKKMNKAYNKAMKKMIK